jgi:di/tricarboxylate transporter
VLCSLHCHAAFLMAPEVVSRPLEFISFAEPLSPQGSVLMEEWQCRAAAFLGTVALWVGGAAIGVNNVAAALCGLAVLLITGVVSWKECLSNNGAWDTLTWFAALIAMAAHLNKFGFIPWFSDQVRSMI